MKISQVVEKGFSQVPVIDISALVSRKGDRLKVASQIGQACRECGFFYIVGHTLMAGIALSLGLEESYFVERYTSNLLTLFRIFNYPPDLSPPEGENRWGVGEHTDYGVLTILKQDHSGGLEVKSKSGWIAAPPIPGSFVCNIGDMLDRMTRGLYRSTPHRVQNVSGRDRLSFPFFFDPNFDIEVKPIPLNGVAIDDDREERWDGASVHAFRGTYGDYVLSKVSKVFPELRRTVL